jgi:hypothetical protein
MQIHSQSHCTIAWLSPQFALMPVDAEVLTGPLSIKSITIFPEVMAGRDQRMAKNP